MVGKNCELGMPEQYVVFDLETTGLSPKKAEIIEIGAVRVKDGKITEKFQTYVKPYGPIPPMITELTGITEKMTENAPRIDEALPKFLKFIGDDILFAHNSSFDCRFIGVACLLLGFDPKNEVRDSLTLARKYIESPNYKLETLKNLLGIKRKSHNAVDDCIVTYAVIEECRKKADLLKA
jgi:DNA polymerase III epsilon subunit family exonuclease